jgi:hypothetical protein
MKKISILGLIAILWVSSAIAVYSQDVQLSDLTQYDAVENDVLTTINRERIKEGLNLLVPNAILREVAETYLAELKSREFSTGIAPQAIYTLEKGEVDQTFADVLTERGYQSYPDSPRFTADILIVTGTIPPAALFSYIQTDLNIGSLNMLSFTQDVRLFPYFEKQYREVGIAYDIAPVEKRDFYVIVVGSQPSVMPFGILEADLVNPQILLDTALGQLVRQTNNRNVILRIPQDGVLQYAPAFQSVEQVRIGESDTTSTCPTDGNLGDGWQNFVKWHPFTLSEEVGIKTVFVEMCDSNGNYTRSSAQLELVSSNFQRDLSFLGRQLEDFTGLEYAPINSGERENDILPAFEMPFSKGYRFAVQAGEAFTIDFRRVEGELNLGIVVLSPSDDIVYTAALLTNKQVVAPIPFARQGEYRIIVFRIDAIALSSSDVAEFSVLLDLE